MSTYPPGAGPEAGRFSGTVYTPPAAGVPLVDTTTGDTTTDAARPLIATAAAVVDSQGRTVATFTAPASRAWLVRRITVQSTIRGACLVYVGTIDPTNVVSGTQSGDLDENDTPQPYLVPEGQQLAIVWAAGGTCSARIEYTEV